MLPSSHIRGYRRGQQGQSAMAMSRPEGCGTYNLVEEFIGRYCSIHRSQCDHMDKLFFIFWHLTTAQICPKFIK